MTKKSTKLPNKRKLQVGDEVFQPLDTKPMGIKPTATVNKSLVMANDKRVDINQNRLKDPHRNPFSNIKGYDVLPLGLYTIDNLLVNNDVRKQQQEFQRNLRNTFTQKPLYDYNYMYGPDSSGGTQYQNLIMAKEGASVRKGTSPDITSVEVEGGEFIQLPNLTTQHVNGPSHEEGGVHTNLPDGARVFSDFIKPLNSKKTYAQLAKKYDTEKYRKVLENTYAPEVDRNTAKLMFQRNESILNELFQDQQKQNGNSDGTDQAKAMAKFGLDLKKGEKLSFTDPFEYGGVYTGGGAEFQDGGMFPENSTFYNNPTGYMNTNNGFYDVIGNANFQTGGTATKNASNPMSTVAELKEKVLSDPKLQDAFLVEYKKLFPNSPATLDDLLNSLETVTSNISELRSKASEDELKNVNLDKGTKNAKYAELAKKYGVDPIKDENLIKRFQGVYRTLATLQENKDFAPLLSDYELTPIGVDDTKWKGSLYSDKGISNADGWFGNTTIGQLVRKKESAKEATPVTGDDTTPVVEETPAGSDINYKGTYQPYPSTMGRFPLYQAAPEALGFMYANRPYSYYTPDFTHTEIAPATLNIDPQLQAIDDSFQSAIRQNTGNASIGNARNTAMFNQALAAKQQAFGNKQNYDAQARFQADQYNAAARDQENVRDLTTASTIYNDYMAAAQDAAEAERLAAISSLTNKYGKFKQDELSKVFNVTNLMPNYYYDGRDPNNPLKLNPYRQTFYNKSMPGTDTTATPVTTVVNQKTTMPQSTSRTSIAQPVVNNEPLVIPELNPTTVRPGYGWSYDNFVPNIPEYINTPQVQQPIDLYPGLPEEDYLPDAFMFGGKIYKK